MFGDWYADIDAERGRDEDRKADRERKEAAQGAPEQAPMTDGELDDFHESWLEGQQ